MDFSTNTMFCRNCKTLVDVLTYFFQSEFPELEIERIGSIEEFKRRLFYIDQTVESWATQKYDPCPACGKGAVQTDGYHFESYGGKGICPDCVKFIIVVDEKNPLSLPGAIEAAVEPTFQMRKSLNEKLHRCPNCRLQELEPWKDGDPCPICGGQVENQGGFLCFD